MLMARVLFRMVLALWCTAAAVATLPVSALNVSKVFVMHRHGARSPGALVNGKFDCGPPHCQLTDLGKKQCELLGRTFGEAYRAPLGLSEYDTNRWMAVSTETSRTILSGESFVVGAFPGALPFVDYVPVEDDVQMSHWTSWPSWFIEGAGAANMASIDDPIRRILGDPFLQQVGETYDIETKCKDSPAQCMYIVTDTVWSNLSLGLAVPAFILDRRADLDVVSALVQSANNGWYPGTRDGYFTSVGSYGFPLASAALYALSNVIHPLDYTVIHRAAHDWSLVALYSALGLWTPERAGDPTFHIAFAETLVLEASTASGATEGADLTWLKAYRWRPQDNGTRVEKVEVGVRCVAKDATVTYTNKSSVGCTITEVWRGVNQTAPESPVGGECYTTKEGLERSACHVEGSPANDDCWFYRESCPAAPCAANGDWIADPANDFACASLVEPSATRVQGKWFGVCAAIAIPLGALVVIGYIQARKRRAGV